MFCNNLQDYSEAKVKGKIKFFCLFISLYFLLYVSYKVGTSLHLTTKISDNYKNLPRNLKCFCKCDTSVAIVQDFMKQEALRFRRTFRL